MKLVFISFFILIVYISFNNTILNPYLFEGADKVKHLLAFFVLSFFFHISFMKINYKFYILTFFAITLELIQSFTYREASFLDFISSFMGILLFYTLLSLYKKVHLS